MGFEPTLGYYPKHAFQACDFNRSSTSPWRDFTARGCLKSDRHSLGCNSPEKNSFMGVLRVSVWKWSARFRPAPAGQTSFKRTCNDRR